MIIRRNFEWNHSDITWCDDVIERRRKRKQFATRLVRSATSASSPTASAHH